MFIGVCICPISRLRVYGTLTLGTRLLLGTGTGFVLCHVKLRCLDVTITRHQVGRNGLQKHLLNARLLSRLAR